jgi:hypothetical protein
MGRGDGKNQASGNLLFGPRSVKLLSKERKKELVSQKRSQTIASHKKAYINKFKQAIDQIIAGDNSLLNKILSEETPKGMIGAEKLLLREVAPKLVDHFYSPYSYPATKFHGTGTLASYEDINTLQMLRIRMHDRQIPDKVINPLADLVANQVYKHSEDQAIEKLISCADEIGDVPATIHCEDYRTHALNETGGVLCGTSVAASPSSWRPLINNSALGVLSIGCPDCDKALKRGDNCKKLSPTEWINILENAGLNNKKITLFYFRAGLGGGHGPFPANLEASDIIDQFDQARRVEINERLKEFSIDVVV